MKPKMTVGRVLLYAILILYAFITLYPFLWMVAASFKPLREIVGGNMALISENMTLDNYATIFGHSSLFPRWFLNSLFVATVGTVINVYVNSMAGYSLSRLSFPGRDKIYHALLLLMMIPGQVLLIPNYLLHYIGAVKGYELGADFLEKIQKSGLMEKFMFAAALLGVMVVGGMTNELVVVSTPLTIGVGETASSVQGILDGIMPGLLSLGVMGAYYKLLDKKVSAVWLIVGTAVLGIVCAQFGILG